MQTKLAYFYQKLPNSLYIDKREDKDFSGTKAMKGKNRVTMMVCFAADGNRLSLSVVGKINQPHCLRLRIDEKPPLPYTYYKGTIKESLNKYNCKTKRAFLNGGITKKTLKFYRRSAEVTHKV